MPNSCVYCGHGKKRGERISLFRFPKDEPKRQQWLAGLDLSEDMVSEDSRVCSRHFLHGDPKNIPSKNLGKSFASPRKVYTDRTKRATKRARALKAVPPPSKRVSTTPSSRASSVSSQVSVATGNEQSSRGESMFSDSSITESSFRSDINESSYTTDSTTALAARVEFLEAETKYLRSKMNTKAKPQHFRVELISSSDSLVKYYTGFVSFQLFSDFFDFLGEAVYSLNYWGESESKTTRHRKRMPLNPLNQYFLTLIKLRLNLGVRDLACRFGISTGLVSKYFTTWICFMYQYLKEINWTPSVDQVAATLPCAFQAKYGTTYSIIDATEIFLQTPSDLFLQSSTWSNYKHHNTAKVLIGCTPNGALSYVSQIYVGSISDVELTRVSGYLDTLDDKAGVSVMADRGFTVRDLLAKKNIALNIPPFMEGKKQLSSEEVKSGRNIASLRIHVERVIGRIKNYAILKSTLPLSMIRLANQIVTVCAWLSNFNPVLIPPPADTSTEEEVASYFNALEDTSSDSDYDADSEMSDEHED